MLALLRLEIRLLHCSLIVGCINGNAGFTKTRLLGYAAYHYGEYIIVPFVCGLANIYKMIFPSYIVASKRALPFPVNLMI